MRTICKLLPIILLASALSLSSCVNEANLSTAGPAIDTNYLHGFTKIQILLTGVRKWMKLDTFGFSMDSRQTSNSTTSNIEWSNTSFGFFASNYRRYIDTIWPHSPPNEEWHVISESFTFQGLISQTVNKIDSGLFEYSYYDSYGELHHQGTNEVYKILKCELLPLFKKDNDIMVFSFSGFGLQSFISQFRDYTRWSDNMSSGTNSFGAILWDQQPPPTLTVTFSK